jgi:hypothetical protein
MLLQPSFMLSWIFPVGLEGNIVYLACKFK